MKHTCCVLILIVSLATAANDIVCNGQKNSYQSNQCCGANVSACIAPDTHHLIGERHNVEELRYDSFNEHKHQHEHKHEYITVQCPQDDDYVVTEEIDYTRYHDETVHLFGKGGSWVQMNHTNITIVYSSRTKQTCTVQSDNSRRAAGGGLSASFFQKYAIMNPQLPTFTPSYGEIIICYPNTKDGIVQETFGSCNPPCFFRGVHHHKPKQLSVDGIQYGKTYYTCMGKHCPTSMTDFCDNMRKQQSSREIAQKNAIRTCKNLIPVFGHSVCGQVAKEFACL